MAQIGGDTATGTQTVKPIIQATTDSGEIEMRPPPVKELSLYRRIFPGKKHLFAPSSADAAEYFIVNRIPNKHANTWRPVFYRGDNPKHTPTSRAVARARRSSLWGAFSIELGDGVGEVLENERRARERKWHLFKQKMRRFFRMKETPPKQPLEDEQQVQGYVMVVKMRRVGIFQRSLTFQIGGKTYRWSGTREFLPRWSKWGKGLSHDFKLVDPEKRVIATFEKKRWASYTLAEKSYGTANKSKSFIGKLRLYPMDEISHAMAVDAARADEPAAKSTTELVVITGTGGETADAQGHANSSGTKADSRKANKNVNLDGHHTGDLLEETIALTCWCVVEAEHRLRYKLLDLLQEVGENIGG